MQKSKFWQTKKFKSLEKKWYEKLKINGFSDAEKVVNGNSVLKQRASNSYRAASATERENKLTYYYLLSLKTNEESFRDSVEKLIMERASDGRKIPEISKELQNLNERCHRETISKVIQKYEVKWGIRKRK